MCVLPQNLRAEPKVIGDNTAVSRDIRPYYRIFVRTETIRGANQQVSTQILQPSDNPVTAIQAQQGWLPIRTPELQVGDVTRREAYFPNVPRPLCVIGADRTSLTWIDKNRDTLIKMDAYCWLVQADTTADLTRVAEHTQGLTVVPASGKVLVTLFGLTHYPVLITGRELLQ